MGESSESAGAGPGVRAGRFPLLAAVAALLVFGTLAGVGVSYLPTNDGPRHLFAIHASQHLLDADTGWGRYFDAVTPTTSQGFGLLFGTLDRWLPWQMALRVSLGFMLVLWMGGAFAFVHTLHPARAWLGVALGAAAFQWTLYMGFLSFYIATALGLWILAFALGTRRASVEPRLFLALLIGVQALLHVAAAAVTGFVVAVALVGSASRGTRVAELGRVALVGLPAALVAVLVLLAGAGEHAVAAHEMPPPELGSAPWWVYGRCFVGGPAWRAWPLTLLAALALPLALLSPRPVDRALWMAGGTLALLVWWLPLHLPTWHFASVRLLPTAVCVMVALLPVERIRAPGLAHGVSAASLVFALASTGWAYDYNRELEARSADALSGLGIALRRDGPRLPINLDPALGHPPSQHGAMPFAVPLANLGHLYALDQGGTVPHNFAVNPTLHHLRFHTDAYDRYPPIPRALYDWAHSAQKAAEPDHRAAIVTEAASYGAFYQDVVFWGRPADIDLLEHRGYEVDWRQGGFGLAHFRGCSLHLEVDDPPDLASDAVLELGWYPLHQTARRIPLAGNARSRPPGLELEVSRVPCGALWLRVRQGPRGARQLAFRCEGADSQGRLLVPAMRETPRVRCQVETADVPTFAAS
jgi:hypothetical protein